MSKSNCEPALLSSLETLQHNLQDAGMLRMKASLYSEAAVREALGTPNTGESRRSWTGVRFWHSSTRCPCFSYKSLVLFRSVRAMAIC